MVIQKRRAVTAATINLAACTQITSSVEGKMFQTPGRAAGYTSKHVTLQIYKILPYVWLH